MGTLVETPAAIPVHKKFFGLGRNGARWATWGLMILLASCWPLFFWRYGFEIADTGWYAVLTRDFFSRPDIVATASPWYLTWGIGACLTALSGHGAWLVLRIAAFLPCMLATIATTTLCLRVRAPLIESGIGILCASLLGYSSFSICIFNYDSMSAAFSCMALCLVLIGYSGISPRLRMILIVLAGVLVALATASRLTSALTLLPAGLCLLPESVTPRWKRIAGMLFGVAVGALLVGAFAAWAGNLTSLLVGLRSFLHDSAGRANASSHSMLALTRLWIRAFGKDVLIAGTLTVLLGTVRRFFARRIAIYHALSTLVFGMAMGAAARHGLVECLPLVLVGIACLELQAESFSLRDPGFRIVLAGFASVVVFSMGSTNGFYVSLFACWLLLPFLPMLPEHKSGRRAVALMLAMLSLLCVYKSFYPYWDQRIDRLDCRFRSGELKGIDSQCSRVREVEGVVAAIVEHSEPGEKIFVAQNSPGLYELANRPVWGDSPWPYLRSASTLAKAFAETGAPPRLIVLDRQNLFNATWPSATAGSPIEHVSGEHKHFTVYRGYIEAQHYVLLYRNSAWEVYGLPKAGMGAAGR